MVGTGGEACSCDWKVDRGYKTGVDEQEQEEEEEEQGVGEEPRTPPPCYGDKLSIPRLREQLQHEGNQQLTRQCSCGKGKRSSRAPDLVKGESSSRRKRVRVPGGHTRVERDTAEPSSHDNCGPEQRFENTEAIRAKYLQEISKIDDPLLRAMHTVVSEAGIEGLTARETAERIISKGLLSEADIPRSVKMAKAMRDSPYLMEINKSSSKFVLWSTFLEESSKSKAKGCESTGACRRRRRSGGSGIVISSGGEEKVVVMKEEEEEVRPGEVDEDVKKESSGVVTVGVSSLPRPPPCQPPKRLMLDLNVVPEDDDAQVFS